MSLSITKNNINNLFASLTPLLILLTWSVFSFILSKQIGIIQDNINSNNNTLISFIISMNNFTSIILPTTIFIFHIITSKIMLSLFEIEIKTKELINIISYAFIPIIVSIILTAVIIELNMEKFNKVIYYESLSQVNFFYSFNLNDFKLFNNAIWIFFYMIIIYIYNEIHKISIIKSILISTLPTLTILIIKLALNYA